MRKEYDFSNSKTNPYSNKLKKQITIRIDVDTITYFKSLSNETGISYQNLINLYLEDCAKNQKKLEFTFQ
ncbi:MAG TPA: BrnA antitoxin family protein [Treponema sp.]|nr:BrnA antitoxin family protein [Treponema sp.]HKL84838.1 BrnA antitoxin family protein [Treponemataceae bacterium]